MCSKKQDLHKNKSEEKKKEEKPNKAQLFFLENEDVLH